VPPGSKAIYATMLLPIALAITLLSALVGRRAGDAATHSFFSVPLVIILGIDVIIFGGFLVLVFGRFFGSGRKKEVETTASMAGKLPESFGQRPKGIVLVGRRGEQRKIHWPGLMNVIIVVVALGVLVQTLFGALIGWSLEAGMMLLSSLLVSAVFLAGMVVRSMALPLDSLTNLDEPSAPMGVETIATVNRVGFWRARIVIVGVRDGRRVIHWPGVVLIAALFVAMTVAVSLIVYWLVPLKGYAPLSNGLIAGYVVGCGLLAMKLQRAWTAPIEKLPHLNG
jgi:hypothetical protein